MKKVRVGVLFGGRSGEHDVSLRSAAAILDAIDGARYMVVPIGITRAGKWLLGEDALRLLAGRHEDSVRDRRVLRGDDSGMGTIFGGTLDVDIVFPVLHGTFGEDGTVQGLLELADIPYVGSGVLGSAAGMDKDVMKRLFREAKLPIVKHVIVERRRWKQDPEGIRKLVGRALEYPVFVKPANLGSSVGVAKVHDASDLSAGVNKAAKYDGKILVEQGVGGKKGKAREIECAILGNEDPKASVPGEIIPVKEYYDYGAKYLDEGSELRIPAKLTRAQEKKVRKCAIDAFRAVGCSGLARVDFLMDPGDGEIYLNEINIMPGFTSASMYPKLWETGGLPFPRLVDRLIRLGLDRFSASRRNRYFR